MSLHDQPAALLFNIFLNYQPVFLQNPADRPNFRTVLNMLRKMGGELPPQPSSGVHLSRDTFSRLLHGERGSLSSNPLPSTPLKYDVPLLPDLPSSLTTPRLPQTSSTTATPTRAAAAGATASAPATPRRWDGGGGARQGDTIVI
jgi:hypothetical protein